MQTATLPRPELIQMAENLAREKNIDKEDVLVAMEQGISKAGRSKYGPEYDIRTFIDGKTGEIKMARYVEVVDEVCAQKRCVFKSGRFYCGSVAADGFGPYFRGRGKTSHYAKSARSRTHASI